MQVRSKAPKIYPPVKVTRVDTRDHRHRIPRRIQESFRPSCVGVRFGRHIEAPLLTCESVLSEASFHLGSTEAVLNLVGAGMLELAFELAPNADKIHYLARRYADRHPDLADLCLVRMSELYPRHAVITVDEEDFRAYRRNKREAVPLLCPPD